MSIINPKNLGGRVAVRTFSWLDLAMRAWGTEFRAPDHNVYKFSSGHGYDSTDRGTTGIYGVVGDNVILIEGSRYPDMRDGLFAEVGMPNGAANGGFGVFDEITRE